MVRSYRMPVAVLLLAASYLTVTAVPMGKVNVELAKVEEAAAAEIQKAEAKAAATDSDSVMPDAEIAIAADAATAESYAPAGDKDAKADAEPVVEKKDVPVIEEKVEVPVPAKKEGDAVPEGFTEPPKAKDAPKEAEKEAPKEAEKEAPKEAPKEAAALPAEEPAAPSEEKKSEEKKEDKESAPPGDEKEGTEETAEQDDDVQANQDGEDEGYDEDGDDDDERLYADQEEDFEGQDFSEEEVKAKGKDAGAEYQRYLAEKREQLKADPNKRAHIVKLLTEIQERDGKLEDEQKETLEIARALQQEEDARSRLEEQERELVEQQRRQAAREQREKAGLHEKANEFDFKDKDRAVWMNEDGVDHKALVEIAKRRASQMGHLDRNRRVAFMQHEMKRLLKFKETIDSSTDTAEKELLLAEHESENEELAKRRAAAPGSRRQLEKVWEEEDGLDKDSFDPKTFFRLHDITGDGVLDSKELEAMFFRESSKLHTIRMRKAGKDVKARSGKDAEQDKFIVREEMARMREHVMKNADTDGDGTVSYDEWMSMTKKKDYDNEKKDWKPIVPEDEMTDKQLSNFKKLQAKLAKTKHKEMDPKLIHAAKRMRKQLSPRQKEALKTLQRKRDDAKNNDRTKVKAIKEKFRKIKEEKEKKRRN